jgi:hypothetical protein
MARIGVVSVVAVLLLWCGTARAQEEDPKQVLERASGLAREEKFDEAIKLWLSVQGKLEPGDLAAAQKKLGLAFQQKGQLAEAWHFLRLYVASTWGVEDDTARDWYKEVGEQLGKTHVKTTFNCTPAGTTLTFAGSKPGAPSITVACPATWWLLPGSRTVDAMAPGHKAATVRLSIAASGDSGVRDVRLEAIPVPVEPVVETKVEPAAEPKAEPKAQPTVVSAPAAKVAKPAKRKETGKAVGALLLTLGLSMGVAGGALHGVGYANNERLYDKYQDRDDYPESDYAHDEYDDHFKEDVEPLRTASYVLYAAGGAAFVGGIVTMAVSSARRKSSTRSPVTLAPMTTPGRGAGAVLTVDW